MLSSKKGNTGILQWCTNWAGWQRCRRRRRSSTVTQTITPRRGTDRARRANNSKVFLAQSPSTYALKRRRRTNQFCAPLCVRCSSSQQQGVECGRFQADVPGVRLSLPSMGYVRYTQAAAVHDGESILHGTLLLAQSSSSWRAAGDGGLNPNGQAAVNKFCVGTTVVVSLHGNISPQNAVPLFVLRNNAFTRRTSED